MSNITVTEVRRRLRAFAKEHENDSNEKQHAQQFWRDFYACFGLSKSSAAMFEAKVLKIDGRRGYVDSFIPSLLLVEHKSLGEDLHRAYEQAQEYFHAIPNQFDKPQYIITCDFQTFHLYDLQANARTPFVCALSNIADHADRFMFLAEKRVAVITEETPVNRKAAYQISLLHNKLLANNFTGRDLEIFLTRLLFCLFADDTGIFGSDGQFKSLIEQTREDGDDTGMVLAHLFDVLNTPHDKRQKNLDDRYKAFEYVNGELFAEHTRIPSFDSELRALLLEAAVLDWTDISPAIFGAMFQAVLREQTRRELGAHYTSERNILKVIEPLFLDELRAEFERAKHNKNRLQALYDKLPTLTFFDPACGCGNFLVIAYRELRKLENDIIEQLFYKTNTKGLFDVSTLCRVNVGQFYGIEIDEAAAHIARVALYITDHQQNIESARRFGTTRATVPLITTPHILRDNALRTDWQALLPAERCSYVMGNPPFVGSKNQTESNKKDWEFIPKIPKNHLLLDYVAAWYFKANNYLKQNATSVAFVSTNSITQGEQVAIIWPSLIKDGVEINFAHRTFNWHNEATGKAGVHCVIIGFSKGSTRAFKTIYEYDNGRLKEPKIIAVRRINPYLIDAADIFLTNRKVPIGRVPRIAIGNKPIDDGNYLFDKDSMLKFIELEPLSSQLFRRWVGAEEFIYGKERWCLYVSNLSPSEINSMPHVRKKIEAVKTFRQGRESAVTKALARFPQKFHVENIPSSDFLIIPKVTTEKRDYIPVGFLSQHYLASDLVFVIDNASLRHFAILSSKMHMAWTRVVCGRLRNHYRYSAGIVYNNFVWPVEDLFDNSKPLEMSGKLIVDIREEYKNESILNLYDPLTMPAELLKAHQANDKSVDKAYGYKGADDDASRVAFLFKLYEQATSLLPATPVKRTRRSSKSATSS